MTINRSEIAKIAELARLQIDESSIQDVTNSIADILAMVDQMQSVDTQGIEPMANPHDAVQRLRADVVTEADQRELFQSLTPHTENGLYLVPKVIE